MLTDPSPSRLPRWRGFNLTEMFTRTTCRPFVERDFAWMQAWGFDYARLAVSYRCWTPDPRRWREVDEAGLALLDQALAWGRQYGIHIGINLHRAPGHCVNNLDAEPFDLWRDNEALEACAHHCRLLAERYRDVPSSRLSLNPLNELIGPPPETIERVYRRLVADIHAIDPQRLVILDGPRWARLPMPSLADLPAAQSYHAYDPIQLCFWRWEGVPGATTWPEPTWPLDITSEDPYWHGRWDSARFAAQCLAPFDALAAAGVGVHVSEVACFRHTPHAVMLAWYRDFLRLWRQRRWGWALWNLRGPFGVVDSERSDLAYENHEGHALDRRLLELLRHDGETP